MLTDEFLEKYRNKQPNWGFNGLGYIVAKRCVEISTPVLCADLKWRPAGELKIGDELIAFDSEKIKIHNKNKRYLRYAKVMYNSIEEADCVGVTLETGETIYCTPDHKWLVKFDGPDDYFWREAKDLKNTKKNTPVYLVRPFGPVWEMDNTFDGGFLSAAYDGEGCLDRLNGIRFSQVENGMMKKVEKILNERNIKFTKDLKNSKSKTQYKNIRQDCYDLKTYGGETLIRFLGVYQPPRLIEKFKKMFKDYSSKKGGFLLRTKDVNLIKVIDVFPAGKRKIAVLSTDLETHFTAGFASHNTYMREIESENRKEEWWETLKRCVNGAQEIGAGYTQEELERLYDYLFNLKGSFSGRGLWQLGTGLVKKIGGPSLLNCVYTDMSSIEDFEFLLTYLSLGAGVGFSVERSKIHDFPKVKSNVMIKHERTNDADFIVPDSREGWRELLHKVMDSYFYTGKSFTYSTLLVRSFGAKINTFGGTASGPEVLIEGIGDICNVLNNRANKKIRSIDVLDICNIIGKIVVAGSSRRSAQISAGDPDDMLFLKAKDWSKSKIPAWRANSNNSIFADSYDEILDEFWKGYNGNGEPYGLLNRKLAKKFGRLGEFKEDSLISGTNPCCLSGDTLVLTDNGWKRIDSQTNFNLILDKRISKNLKISKNKKVLYKGKGKTFEIKTKNGRKIKATNKHKFMTPNGWVELRHLRINDLINVCDSFGTPNIDNINSIEYVGIEDVYDILNTDTNSFLANEFVVHNSEIFLEDGEVCNLAEIYLPNISSKEELIDLCKLLYKTQKAVTNLKFPFEKTNKVVQRNRRLGLGVTGWMQSSKEQIEWLGDAYNELKQYDIVWSKYLGINQSIKLTTCKPSGSLSLLAGVTPGIHPAFARYYIRRVRMGTNDPLVEYCKKLGYQVQYDINLDGREEHTRMVVSFPCQAPEHAVLSKDLSAIEQLEWVVKAQTIWADNAVSVTVYYKPEELENIKNWLKENYKDKIKSVSFLRHSDHGFVLPPYEEITKEEYEKMTKKLKPIVPFNSSEDYYTDISECDGGACPIK